MGSYHGIKRIGHLVKSLLPLPLFKMVLAGYHCFRRICSLPKVICARGVVKWHIYSVHRSGMPIRFGFYVVLDSMFQFRRVFELMLRDDRFAPFIVVAPRISYGDEDMIATMEETYSALVRDFGKDVVFKGYEDGVFNNRIKDCDACAMMNVYHGLAKFEFETEYFAMHGIPIFSSQYGYTSGTLNTPEYYGMSSLWFVHRFYCANAVEKGYFDKYQGFLGNDQAVVSGCPQSDAIVASRGDCMTDTKIVLIAPHHSVIPAVNTGICLGNFLRFKDLFLQLPKRYPKIKWIFRPHPHLRFRLEKDLGWDRTWWEVYIKEFTESPNAEYEAGGSYYASFTRSDAIIEDCGSFLPEYFYTGKPLCYMLEGEKAKLAQFNAWGIELVEHTYQAFSEEDITRFIEDVVIGGKDTMREKRLLFAKERVMINYPHASETVVEDIAETLGRGKGKSV